MGILKYFANVTEEKSLAPPVGKVFNRYGKVSSPK